jgi:hypothetical protein
MPYRIDVTSPAGVNPADAWVYSVENLTDTQHDARGFYVDVGAKSSLTI